MNVGNADDLGDSRSSSSATLEKELRRSKSNGGALKGKWNFRAERAGLERIGASGSRPGDLGCERATDGDGEGTARGVRGCSFESVPLVGNGVALRMSVLGCRERWRCLCVRKTRITDIVER